MATINLLILFIKYSKLFVSKHEFSLLISFLFIFGIQILLRKSLLFILLTHNPLHLLLLFISHSQYILLLLHSFSILLRILKSKLHHQSHHSHILSSFGQ